MSLSYRTEYQVGRDRRICRTYTGVQAFAAILFDLVFGLVFELIVSVIALSFRLVVLLMVFVSQILKITTKLAVAILSVGVSILTLPFALLHHAIHRFQSPVGTGRNQFQRPGVLKPEWAYSREV